MEREIESSPMFVSVIPKRKARNTFMVFVRVLYRTKYFKRLKKTISNLRKRQKHKVNILLFVQSWTEIDTKGIDKSPFTGKKVCCMEAD